MDPSTHKHAHRLTRHLRWIVVTFVVLFLAGYLGIGAVAANALTTPQRQFNEQNTPARLGLAYEPVRFPARGDAVEIAGWHIPSPGSRRAVVLVHGKDVSRTIEFDERLVELAASLNRAGLNVLMIDLRGHGHSGDAHFSFGLRERRDIQGAVDWLVKSGVTPGSIGVLGVSLGAASAIGATADDPRIGALVTDSAFAEFCPVLQANWNGQTGLPDALIPPVVLMTQVLFGYDVCMAQPVREIGRIAPRPVLLIHSTTDQMVALSHFEKLAAAAPFAATWVVSGPEHARIYNADPVAYSRQVTDFFDTGLKPGGLPGTE